MIKVIQFPSDFKLCVYFLSQVHFLVWTHNDVSLSLGWRVKFSLVIFFLAWFDTSAVCLFLLCNDLLIRGTLEFLTISSAIY